MSTLRILASVSTPDAETRLDLAPAADHPELRLWLRLFTCSTLVETTIRRRLRAEFGETLPRFDLLAQLAKVPAGLTLSELSKRMMVSNGNLTALVERLVEAGWIERQTSATDRRAQVARLTAAGRAAFRKMAAAHERWIVEMTGGLAAHETEQLMGLLAKWKASARRAFEGETVA
jgi:DNA-binding MarR family transcriptional regulator